MTYTSQKYIGLTNPVKPIEYYCVTWETCPWREWVHHFVHTLYMIPRHRYILVDTQRGTLQWDEMATIFTCTFKFNDDHPLIDAALQVIKMNIFEDIPMSITIFNQSNVIVQH